MRHERTAAILIDDQTPSPLATRTESTRLSAGRILAHAAIMHGSPRQLLADRLAGDSSYVRHPHETLGLRWARWEMDAIACELLRSGRVDPAGFEAREGLWMRRDQLRCRRFDA